MNRITRTRLAVYAATLLVAVTALTGCRLKNRPEANDYVQLAQDSYLAQSEQDNLHSIGTQQLDAAETGKTAAGAYWQLPEGAVVTATRQGDGWLIHIDLGSAGLLCNDGRIRKGQGWITSDGPWLEQGTVWTLRTEGYAVSYDGGQTFYNHHLSRTVTNAGQNSSNQYVFNVTEADTIVTPENETVYWSSSRVRTWISGQGDLEPDNDVYQITGSASGSRQGSYSYRLETVNPLEIHLNCAYVYSGTVRFTLDDYDPIVIDYGSGCASGKTGTVTYNGRTYTFRL